MKKKKSTLFDRNGIRKVSLPSEAEVKEQVAAKFQAYLDAFYKKQAEERQNKSKKGGK